MQILSRISSISLFSIQVEVPVLKHNCTFFQISFRETFLTHSGAKRALKHSSSLDPIDSQQVYWKRLHQVKQIVRMVERTDYTTEILSFVLDSFQVVSYKWLSRKFSITSNEAKRLLQMIAEQHGSNLEVIYAVSGWSKEGCHSIQLVPESKLQEAKDMIDGHVSVHVYSIQPSIPKDPAELWSAEYVQAEELYKQSPQINNCLRDNRFSAVGCVSVDRNFPGTSSPCCKVDAQSSLGGFRKPSSMEGVRVREKKTMMDTPSMKEDAEESLEGKTSRPELAPSPHPINAINMGEKEDELPMIEQTHVPDTKKRKVLKTYIDRYGQEATEVVQEDKDVMERHEQNARVSSSANTLTCLEPTKSTSKRSTNLKSTTSKSSGKASSKDACQGKISSFFKKI